MTTPTELPADTMRLDVLVEACMRLLGMDLAEAEAEVRHAAELFGWALTEVGHA